MPYIKEVQECFIDYRGLGNPTKAHRANVIWLDAKLIYEEREMTGEEFDPAIGTSWDYPSEPDTEEAWAVVSREDLAEHHFVEVYVARVIAEILVKEDAMRLPP